MQLMEKIQQTFSLFMQTSLSHTDTTKQSVINHGTSKKWINSVLDYHAKYEIFCFDSISGKTKQKSGILPRSHPD